MKNLLLWVSLACLSIILALSACQDQGITHDKEAREYREQLVELPYWEAVNQFQQHRPELGQRIWKDKLDQVLSLDLSAGRKDRIENLLAFVQSEAFLTAPLANDYLDQWAEDYREAFNQYELFAITLTFNDLPSTVLQGDANLTFAFLQEVGAVEPEYQAASKRQTLPGGGYPDCNCRWGWWCATTCDEGITCGTESGCGFLWAQDCKGRCDDPQPIGPPPGDEVL